MKRDTYFRCKWCKGLFKDDECERAPDGGYICPLGCVAPFIQPPYQSPLISDESAEHDN